jgi:methyl halide transferase
MAGTLQEHFKDKPLQEHGRLWNQLWERKTTGWDRGGPSLALHETLHTYPELFDGTYPDLRLLSDFVGHDPGQRDDGDSSKAADVPQRRKTALVPACGTGYDAVLLAEVFGYDVVGLDISPAALFAAREYFHSVTSALCEHLRQPGPPPGDDSKMRFWIENRCPNPGSIRWVTGDFFSHDWLAAAGVDKFDLVFDYTVSQPCPCLRSPKTPAHDSFPCTTTLLLPGPAQSESQC